MTAILCTCDHDIDAHSVDVDQAGDACWRCIIRWGQGDITLADVCRRPPSEIARALLTAEPTPEEVVAVTKAWMFTDASLGIGIVQCERITKAVLRAARGLA